MEFSRPLSTNKLAYHFVQNILGENDRDRINKLIKEKIEFNKISKAEEEAIFEIVYLEK